MIHEQECNAAAQRKASVPKPAARSAAFGTFDPLMIATTTSSHLPAQQSHAALLRRIGNDRSSTRRFLLRLQQEYGNRHVQQVLASASRQTSVEPGFATRNPTLMKARSEVPADKTSESPVLCKAAEPSPAKQAAPILRSGSSIPGTISIENIDPPDMTAPKESDVVQARTMMSFGCGPCVWGQRLSAAAAEVVIAVHGGRALAAALRNA